MRLATLLLIPILFLAGCSSGGTPADTATPTTDPPAPPAEFDAATGAVAGVVVDAEALPIKGVDVALPDLALNATTDGGGRFSFSHLDPGTYTVFASKLGYESQGRQVAITAGELTELELTLVQLAVEEPFSLTFIERGRLGCAVQVDPVNGLSACGLAAIVTILTGQDTSNIDRFNIPWDIPHATEPWQTGVFEMQWESTQALGRGLQVIWEVNLCPGDGDLTFGITRGESPLQVRVEKGEIASIVNESSQANNCLAQGLVETDTSQECNEDRCNLQSRVFSAAETTGQEADVGVAFQQTFEQYVTNFYYAPGPAGFTALPDA